MSKARWAGFGAALGAVISCGGATFTSAPGDGGGTDDGTGGGSSGAGSSSSGASSSSGGSSGATSSGGSGGGSSSGGSSSGGSSGSSGGRCDAGCVDAGTGPCPAQAPGPNTPCSHSGLVCEYGSGTVQGCDLVATCGSSGWAIQAPTLTCGGGTLPPSCPASYSLVPQGTTCTANGLVCDYLMGRCSCNAGGGIIRIGPDGGVIATWYCQAPAMGCPQRRPPLGSTCTTPTLSCDYGACYVPGGTTETCTNGVWVESFTPCPA